MSVAGHGGACNDAQVDLRDNAPSYTIGDGCAHALQRCIARGFVASHVAHRWVFLWAIGGVLALVGEAIVRLTFIARHSLSVEWRPWHFAVLIAWTLAMVWGEGYRVFQRYLAPRVVARARSLADKPVSVASFFAPFYVLSFFSDEPRRLGTAWGVSLFIVVFAVSMHHVPDPWRGIVDAGVVAALSYGVMAIVREAIRR